MQINNDPREPRSMDIKLPPPTNGAPQPEFPGIGMTLMSYNHNPFNNMQRPPVPKPKVHWWQRLFTKRNFKRVGIFLGVIVAIGVAWLAFKFIYNSSKIFGGNVLSILDTTRLDGEENGRVNILLAGNSADDPGHAGGNLTDSIMLVSIDTKHHKAFLLSIPRDTWVNIPGHGHHKINTTYVYGQQDDFKQNGYAPGGMGLLEKVVQSNFGIKPNYYALINYNAFRDTVNAVGGVDVTIQSSDKRGLYDPNIGRWEGGPLRLTNGLHHLDGKTALNLARARGDSPRAYGFPQSDFDRTQHQRQLLLALKKKVVSTGVIANPVKISSLLDALGNNVKTDLKLSEVKRLYEIGKQIDNSKIQSLSLNDADGKNLLMSYRSASGESALIPAAGVDDFSAIKSFLRRHTSTNPLVQEAATVTVLNGTDTNGLAGTAKAKLERAFITVDGIADARTTQATTTIIDASNGQKPATLKQLKQFYGNDVTTSNPYARLYDSDFIVILGDDQTTTAND